MTTETSTQVTVGQLVREDPARSRVFENLGIDYCCGGKKSLEEACRSKGLDPHTVAVLLAAADRRAADAPTSALDPDAMKLTELADHIEQTHHVYLRDELPRLDAMTEKVFRVHGEREPRLAQVRRAFSALSAELTQHMMKEERILFPIIRELERADGLRAFHCGSVANPIRQMEAEHQHAGDALAIMREATDGYEPPEWACNTYRAMLDGLALLERDMHRHVYKENNILFPKAIELEERLQEKPGA